MKRRINFSFLVILLIVIFCLFVNLVTPLSINVTVPLPFSDKKIAINQKFPGIDVSKVGIHRNFAFRRGLDLEGGTSVTLRADMHDIPSAQRDDALDSAKTVIERRVNLFGVSEPVVQTSKANKDYRIIVEIPGVSDVNEAVKLVGQTAKLSFWEAGASNSAQLSPQDTIKLALAMGKPVGVVQLLGVAAKQTNLTGSDLKLAAVTFDPQTSKPQVELTFSPEGGKKFGDITKRNVGKILAIALDNELIEAPRVNGPIYGGNAVISGGFTTDQAKTLQIQLNAGALPVSYPFLNSTQLEQHSVRNRSKKVLSQALSDCSLLFSSWLRCMEDLV